MTGIDEECRAVLSGFHGFDLAPLVWQAFTEDREMRLRPLSAADVHGPLTVKSNLPGESLPAVARPFCSK